MGLLIDQTTRSFRKSCGKKDPRQNIGEEHKSVRRRVLSGEFYHLTKNDSENGHRQKWPDEGPSDADDRLFVPDGNVAPSQNLEQFAVMPEIAPVVFSARPASRMVSIQKKCKGNRHSLRVN